MARITTASQFLIDAETQTKQTAETYKTADIEETTEQETTHTTQKKTQL